MFLEHLRGTCEFETARKTHTSCNLADDPPVRLRLSRQRQEGALAGDVAIGVGDGTVLLAPGGGRQQHMGESRRVGVGNTIGHHDQLAACERLARSVGVRQAHHRVGCHDPHGLDAAMVDGLEHVDRFEAWLGGQRRGLPEPLHQAMLLGVIELHMCRERIGKPADLAPTHGIGLSGDREGSHAGSANAPRREVHVDDAVGLVSAGGGLIHALRERRDHAPGGPEPFIEALQRRRVDTRLARDRRDIARRVLSNEQRPGGTAGVVAQEFLIEVFLLCQPA